MSEEKTPPAPLANHLVAAVQNLGLAAIVSYAWLGKAAISSEVAMLFLAGIVTGVAVPALKPTGPNAAAAGAAGVLSSLIEGVVRSVRPPAPAPVSPLAPIPVPLAAPVKITFVEDKDAR